MKRNIALLTLWLAASALAPAVIPQPAVAQPEDDQDQPAVRDRHRENGARELIGIGRDVILHSNEVTREVVCIGADANIEGTVRNDAVIIFGKAKVTGNVQGELVSIFSDIEVGPDAVIRRGMTLVGGRQQVSPSAQIHGKRFEAVMSDSAPHSRWFGDWVMHGLLLGRPLAPRAHGAWIVVGILAAAYLLVALLLPRPLQACATGLVERPVGSFLLGILGLILCGPIIFLLIVSVAGVVAIPFLLMGLLVALFLGKAAIYRVLGEQIADTLRLSFLHNSILAMLAGGIVFFLIYMVPVFGILVWSIATIWALGAVLMALFRGTGRRPSQPLMVLPVTAAAAGVPTPATTGQAPASTTAPADAVNPAPPPIAPPPPLIDAIAVPRAGFWIRLLAAGLDWLLLGLVTLFHARPPLFLVLLILYHVAMWTWKGTTLGGIVLGIKVVRLDGRPLDFAVALVRSLSSLFSAAALFLGFFWAGWDSQKQSWHDKIAGTVLVKVGRGTALL